MITVLSNEQLFDKGEEQIGSSALKKATHHPGLVGEGFRGLGMDHKLASREGQAATVVAGA